LHRDFHENWLHRDPPASTTDDGVQLITEEAFERMQRRGEAKRWRRSGAPHLMLLTLFTRASVLSRLWPRNQQRRYVLMCASPSPSIGCYALDCSCSLPFARWCG
jgi:hypothetical protein